mgnify:CR=1 FL=1
MKRQIYYYLVLVLIILFVHSSCKESIEEIFLSPESSTVLFENSEKQNKLISFETNASIVSATVPASDAEWCTVDIEEKTLRISVAQNPSLESRSTVVHLSADDKIDATIEVTQPGRVKSSTKRFNSFVIPASINNLKNDIVGVVDNYMFTITLKTTDWIPNVKTLAANFDAVGTVYVDEKIQESGQTPNSFLNELTYTVVAEDGTSVNYKVIGKGPMFTGLPVISVDIEGGLEVIEKTVKLPSTLNLVNTGNEDWEKSNASISIRGRGNSTWSMPKKPYRIDFPSKTSMFGLPAAKKWVLLANYQDPTLLMNDIAFELGKRFGLQYNHSSIHVELFINGTYRGNYQLTEQNEIGEGRVNVDKNNGFLVELDQYYDEDYKFRSNYLNLPVMVIGPDLESEVGMTYIKEAFQAFENSLFESGFPNESFMQYCDIKSLIDYMLINEIVRNQELFHPKSTFCYKDVGSPIKWGPLWDFDWAFGYNESNKYFVKKDLLFYRGSSNTMTGSKFFNRFMEVPEFKKQYVARWKQMKPQVADIVNYIDDMSAKLTKSQQENFKIATAKPVTMNASYQELIEQMKTWLTERIAFLDQQFASF